MEEDENDIELTAEKKAVLDERLSDYYKCPLDVVDFDTTIDDIEKSL